MKKPLKIIHLNVRSNSNNRNALEHLILSNNYDILIFTETWLTKAISIPTTKYKFIDLLSHKQERGKGIRIVYNSEFIATQRDSHGSQILTL